LLEVILCNPVRGTSVPCPHHICLRTRHAVNITRTPWGISIESVWGTRVTEETPRCMERNESGLRQRECRMVVTDRWVGGSNGCAHDGRGVDHRYSEWECREEMKQVENFPSHFMVYMTPSINQFRTLKTLEHSRERAGGCSDYGEGGTVEDGTGRGGPDPRCGVARQSVGRDTSWTVSGSPKTATDDKITRLSGAFWRRPWCQCSTHQSVHFEETNVDHQLLSR
jgi:hypothetical protein